MSIEDDMKELAKSILSMRLSMSDNYNEILKQHFENVGNIDFDKILKKLPATRKSTVDTALKHIKEAYFGENLTLVLGSGISAKYGIPTWDYLLQRLILRTITETPEKATVLSKIFTKIFNPSPLIAGRYLQESFAETKQLNRFEQEVRKALYETYDENAVSPIMEEIIKLCIAPGNSPLLDSIITYNYDDILEKKLRELNLDIPFQSVYGHGINPDIKDLPIYHAHGFLPKEGPIGNNNTITLGEYVYHEQYNNIYSWNNIVQINKFRDKTCLFLGTSLSDPNIRRLLDIANSQKIQKSNRKYHYILKKKTTESLVKQRLEQIFAANPDIFNEKVKAKMDIIEIIRLLINIQTRFEEKDSESLGVKTVWIEDYDTDISDFLNRIKN